MKRFVLIAPYLLFGSLLGLWVCSAADGSVDLAVIVNKSISLETLSASDLRLMILGEKSKWPDGKNVIAVQTPPESAEKALQTENGLQNVRRRPEAILHAGSFHRKGYRNAQGCCFGCGTEAVCGSHAGGNRLHIRLRRGR